jgi:phosphoribosylamine---glycine ligase
VAGPLKMAAQLEGSKDFAKAFMQRHNIPTAAYRTFTVETLEEGFRFLKTLKAPYVLKADGLAAGKGVVILPSLAEAMAELSSMLLDARFGEASRKVVIEEFLSGIELSVFVITDGDSYKILPEAKDYKKIGEGDTGPNTGGMGSVSPVPFASAAFMEKVETRVIKPTIDGLKQEGIPYKGFIFFGLINVNGDPFVIEYNCRMGDPEAESVIPRIKNDLLRLFIATGEGTLEREEISVDPRFTATVILVSEGYPGDYEKGREITGLDRVTGSLVFHSGTKQDALGNILTNGGRVIAVTSFGETMHDALEKSYQGARLIRFEGAAFRRDIGFDL